MRKIFNLMLVVTLLLTMTTTSLALPKNTQNEVIQNNILKDKTIQEYLSRKENIKVPTYEDTKNMLIEVFSKNPEGNEHNLKNIDTIAQECVNFVKSLANNDISTQEQMRFLEKYEWVSSPTITSTSYSKIMGKFHERDNRKSSLPATVTFSSTMTKTISVGFSGSGKIKKIIQASIDIDGSFTHTETVTEEVTVPAYTFWKRQVYAIKKSDKYSGEIKVYKYMPVLVGGTYIWKYVYSHNETESGTNTYGDGGGVDYTTIP